MYKKDSIFKGAGGNSNLKNGTMNLQLQDQSKFRTPHRQRVVQTQNHSLRDCNETLTN